ncbi:MAG: hypothetical protein JST30_16665 [Armatimonadetes bacterium]|nr:hypothetical protein [Armatimonadota bacterium]
MNQERDGQDPKSWPIPDRSGGLRPGHRDVYPATEEPTFTPELTHPMLPKGTIPLKPKPDKRKSRKQAS